MANIPATPGDFHVLIVDDEAGVREVLYELVTEQGYRVTTASGGQKALQVLAQDRADIVITDLMMPDMNGWQLLKLIKQRYEYIPVVVLTGYISEEGEEMLTNNQTDGYLVKPVDRKRLNEMLASFLTSHRPGRTADIVILDDDATALAALEHALSTRGFRVATFQDPGDVLEHIRNTGPDLVILDLIMPNADGFEICQRLKDTDQTSRIPVLILTAAPSRENVLKAVKLNVNGFIAKPFDPKALVDRVRQLLKVSQSTSSNE